MLSPKEPNLPYVIYELSLTNTQKLANFLSFSPNSVFTLARFYGVFCHS